MSQTVEMTGARPGGRQGNIDVRAIPILMLGCALSAFFIVSYGICIVGYLLFPGFPVQHEALAIFLPGFTLLSWYTFFLGLIESFLWGWYIAVVFGAIYNFFLRHAAWAA